MNFSVHRPQLPSIDDLQYNTLVLTYFSDERPLRGLSGLVDWRLNGNLSRMVQSGRLTGNWGEQLLYPQAGRLPFRNIVMFGLGDRSRFGSTRFKEISNRILRTLMRLECSSFATSLPGRNVLKLVPRQLIDLWLGEFQKVFLSQRYNNLEYEIGFLEPRDFHDELDEPLSMFRRQHIPRP